LGGTEPYHFVGDIIKEFAYGEGGEEEEEW